MFITVQVQGWAVFRWEVERYVIEYAELLLFVVFSLAGDDSLVWHILLILEEAVEKSPSFAQFKLLLMFLYYKLGR